MKIINDDTGLELEQISIYLTHAEALQCIGYLKQLLNGNEETAYHHAHLSNKDYSKEITLMLEAD